MHIAKDYIVAFEYAKEVIDGNDLMCQKEVFIRFVDKYRELYAQHEQLKSQKEKVCQKKPTQSKSSKKQTRKNKK